MQLRALLLAACACVLTATGLAQELDRRGVWVRTAAEEVPRFVAWSEPAVQAELTSMREAGGGELRFGPGEYVIETGFEIHESKDIRIAGTPATVLRFAPAPEDALTLTAGASVGDRELRVDGAGRMVAGRRYQVYPQSGEGDRLLEFVAKSIDGDRVTLERPVHYMGHVEAIPTGSRVIQEINAFRVMRSSNITFESLTIDGVGRGDVRGHTTFCGLYVVGNPPGKRFPILGGLTVRGCTFERLTGRGVCVYRMTDIDIDACTVRDVRTEGLEIDHFSSGRITGCDVDRCGVGIALNDAFETTVERNTVSRCSTGIALIKHFTHPHVNRALVVQDNVVRACQGFAIGVRPGIEGNVVRRNRFAEQPVERWINGGDGNELTDNRAL